MRRYWLTLLPLGLGLVLAALWQAGLWPNPILYLRVDVGTLLLLLGFLGSLVWVLSLALWTTAGRRGGEEAQSCFRREQADAHRRFIRRLDHEIKNPLTAIRAGLANLTDQGDSAILSSVRAQVDRLARLSADLRKLADLDTQPVEREPVDLSLLLTELVELAQERPEAAVRHLRLTLPQAPWPLPSVAGDRDLLFLALHNLVDNALKFSRPQDTIEIRAFEDGPAVVVEVADTGPGVSEDELPHLGEELYRGNMTRDVEGSGLGLALVQAIVARHQGTMVIRSRRGQGTVVSLRLPVAR
ncbi:MAG: HAMP domain-containing histidine kinase [Anaerolineae bacterium]|jgi:two-component system OmpR family sensor kinase|nr:HAMP domain-containing histidine kinase [Anaerolineae bacterium]